MTATSTSTVAALCFAKPTGMDFPLLATELGQALRSNPRINCRETREFEDFVIFDLERTRICLAYCEVAREFPHIATPGRFHSCLIVSVGNTPDLAGAGPLFESRHEVCRGLVDRVESRHQSDKFLWIEIDEAFSEQIYDMILEQIWPELAETESTHAAAAADLAAVDLAADLATDLAADLATDAPPAESARGSGRPDELLPTLEARFDEEMRDLQARIEEETTIAALAHDWDIPTPKRPTHPAMDADEVQPNPLSDAYRRELAELLRNDPPSAMSLASWDLRDAQRVRNALYPPEDENGISTPVKSPLPQRLTIYTLNTACMVVSLPIGAAAMTYSLLGRESMSVAARTMALTGLAIGTSAQLSFGHTILSFLS